jgi:alpha-beta hydrolase superfamily lysophospholipase
MSTRPLSKLLTMALTVALPLAIGACTSHEATEPSVSSEAAFTDECRPLPASWMNTKRISVDGGNAQLRVGEARPASGEPVADILYLHGFSDRMDNHKPLFDQWTKRGARVVAFEYPSHGESCGLGLGAYTFTDLVDFATVVEKDMVEDQKRPLYLAGWSTGGLIATRLAQGYRDVSRPIAGTMLFAPGIAVHVVLGEVTLDSLTSLAHPPHTGPIAPTRPALYALFSAGLLLQSHEARSEPFPATIPTILFTGGEQSDTYADTAGLQAWVGEQRERAEPANIALVTCEGGKHELDNEAEPMGQEVRSMAGEFFSATTMHEPYVAPSAGPCNAR